MAAQVSEAFLTRFSEFVVTHFGLNFPPNRYSDLERNALAACKEFGFDDPEACFQWLNVAPLDQKQTEVLASHLTVGETYFFREKAIFELLEHQILPALIHSRRAAGKRLRIWSAGCATGEEPYSLAILLTKLLPDWREWNVTILGTDINVQALRKAATGIYGKWSFRNAPSRLKGSYVQEIADGRFEVRQDIRARVIFSYHNLMEDAYPSLSNNTNAMDIILCCNVLMYFQPETARRMVEGFHHSLVDGGWLIVGAGEAIPALFPQFERVSFPDATLFRREAKPVQVPVAPAAPTFQPGSALAPEPVGYAPAPVTAPAWVALSDAAREEVATAVPAPPPTFEDACILYGGGRYAEAGNILRLLAEPRARALMARIYANQGNLAEALCWCDEALRNEKTNPHHHYLRASILQELGREADAAESLKHTLFLDPDFVLAHLALGSLLLRQGRRKEAQRPFQIAIALLRGRPFDETFPDSEGMTAGRLMAVALAAQNGTKA